MKAVILAGGNGSRIWPYNYCRHKTNIPIGNKPIIRHQIEALRKTDIEEILIVGDVFTQELKHDLRKEKQVQVIEIEPTRGSAESLLKIYEYLDNDFLVLYGDCLIDERDLIRFVDDKKDVLLSQLHTDAKETICVELDSQEIKQFWGHPRGDNWQYFAAVFHFDMSIFTYLKTTQNYFQTTKVGVGSPLEIYLENALNDKIQDGYSLQYIVSEHQIYDIDKPWHILEANQYYNHKITHNISTNTLGEGSQISPHAKIDGYVVVGKNSYIGDYVVISGNVMIGDNTVIDNGAIIGNGTIIGNRCRITNHCKIGEYCSIGDECIIDQTAELLGGILFSKVYLYHYGEYYGIAGKNTDIGAGTTVGTLRFDDGETSHYIKGKRQIPQHFSNACFIGDFSRTGVGAILLPGCKVGCKSIVGSGVILNEDVENETLIYAKQELIKAPWGDSQYHW